MPVLSVDVCFETPFDDAYHPPSLAKPHIAYPMHTVSRLSRLPKLAEGHLRAISYLVTLYVTSILNYPTYHLITRRIV